VSIESPTAAEFPEQFVTELAEFRPDPWPRLAVAIGLCNFILLVALAVFR